MRSVLVIPEGVDSSDGRSYDPGLLTWRDSVPLQFTDETTEGHEGSFHVGNLSNFRRQTVEGVTWIVADLTYDNDEEAVEAQRLSEEGKLPGVSADVAQVWEETDEIDEMGFPVFRLVSAEIVGATQVPMPAFGGARILTDAESVELVPPLIDSMVAAAFAQLTEWQPPRELFEVPEPDEPTPITVYQAGDFIGFYGHAAEDWDQCHLSFAECVPPPYSPSEGAEFNTRALTLADGSQILVGPVTMSTSAEGGHADLRASVDETVEHYDNANTVMAAAHMSNGVIAPWLSGVILPDVTPGQLTRFKLMQLSGDWRRINGELDMKACLAVPIGGFGIKARVASGQVTAMIAAGPKPFAPKTDLQLVAEAIETLSVDIREAIKIAIGQPDDSVDEDDEPHGDFPPLSKLAAVLDRSTVDAVLSA